jgi:L-ascorbate metabolism protein UlaG (beta-lactamase superfamily)
MLHDAAALDTRINLTGDTMLERIHWLGHASFRINGPPHNDAPVIYIDPWRLPDDSPPADVILISHDHYDHCSPDDIAKIQTPDTLVVSNQRGADLLGGNVHVVAPWQGGIRVGEISLRFVPAYTIHKAYHDRGFGGLGFLISFMRHDIYFAGDTDLIPEMDKIYCDIALLPVGGAFTMNFDEAAEAVARLRPQYAIPMHFGREVPGSQGDGHRFCQLVNGGAQAVELPIENSQLK